MKYTTQKIYAFLGISSATLCLLHCLLMPFLSILSVSFFDNVWFDLLFCFIGIFAVLKISLVTDSKIVKFILISSILIVAISVMIEMVFGIHFEGILIGGLGLIVGHLINYKKHKHL